MTAAAPSLTFLGDLTAPAWNPPRLAGFRAWLGDSVPVVNLEGPIVPDFAAAKPRSALKFNLASMPGVLDALAPAIVTIANNHYEDFAEIVPPDRARDDVTVIGARAGAPVLRTIGGRRLALVGICFPATDPLRWRRRGRIAIEAPRRALQRLEAARRALPDAVLIAVVHWGYEFSRLPFPADRAWTRRAFDCGVDLVIGHHPHVIQPIERFGGKTVAYSLGNFYLPNGTYFGNRLDFDPVCDRGLALHFDGRAVTPFTAVPDYRNGDVAIHPADDRVTAPFAGQSDREYRDYFREQLRVRRARVPSGIPALESYFGGGEAAFFAWQDARQWARNTLLRLGLRNPYKKPA
ncbi:MAG TPA: CapA family protein [Dongiaceae bacterium]|nr:CapA family protein [Dongiaceae bacterium]